MCRILYLFVSLKISTMKKTFLLIATVFIFKLSFSQAAVSTAEYNKITKPAVIADIPFTSSTVEGAILDTLNKLGYKTSKDKDYILFKGVKLAALGDGTYDLYFKANRVSKKEKDKTTFTMLISKGYENFISDATDHDVVENAKSFLNNMIDVTAAYDLEQQIKGQQDIKQKADRKLQSLMNDSSDLARRKQKIEQEIADNLKAQEDQKNEIIKQQGMLDTLIGKRKQ